MKHLNTVILVGIISAMALTASHAANPNFGERAVKQINGEGFRTCKALGNSGYTATASGILSSGTARGSGKFRLRTCFRTLGECKNFLARIPNLVGKIDTIRHRTCKPR